MGRSTHEAPWGHRMAYTGGQISQVTLNGPGLQVFSKKEIEKNRPNVSEDAMLAERAALAGQSVTEYRKIHGDTSKSDSTWKASGCYNCGEEGHFGRDCPAPKKAKRGRYSEENWPGRGGQFADNGGRQADEWYYIDNAGEQQGPFPLASLQAWFKAGQIPETTKVKKGAQGVLRAAGLSIAVSGKSKEELNSERRTRQATGDKHKLYVGGIGEKVDGESLAAAFEKFGTILDIWLPKDVAVNEETKEKTGKPRGYAFVTMATQEEADAAEKELDGSIMAGKKLRVNPSSNNPKKRNAVAQPDLDGGNSGGNSGGGDDGVQGMYGESDPMGVWAEMVDPSSGAPYFWNAITDEKKWSLPGRKFKSQKVAAAPAAAAAAGGDALGALGGYGSDSD